MKAFRLNVEIHIWSNYRKVFAMDCFVLQPDF